MGSSSWKRSAFEASCSAGKTPGTRANSRRTVKDNFAEKVVSDPLFKRQKRLNELFDLEKAYNIHAEMTPQQILMWANSLLKPFSLQIKAGQKVYRLELQNDLLNLINRKSEEGRLYKDNRGLLKQMVPERFAKYPFEEGESKDLFADEETNPLDRKRGLDFGVDFLK